MVKPPLRLKTLVGLLLIAPIVWWGGRASAYDASLPLAQRGNALWQIEQGLPQNSVQALVQTRDGYLWIGSQEGLTRFDGVRFTTFDQTNTPALLNKNVRALYEDRDGTLWIGTNGGLNSLRDGRFASYAAREGLADLNIETLLGDRDGSLWVGTNGGLFRLRDGVFTAYKADRGLTGDVIEAVYQTAAGELWVGTNAGLHLWQNNQFTRFAVDGAAEKTSVLSVRELRDGLLLVGTDEGLYRFRDGSFTRYAVGGGDAKISVVVIAEDARGHVWAGANRGMFRLRGDTLQPERLTDDNSLRGVQSMLEDAERNLWFGTAGGGLYRFYQNKFAAYTARDGLANDMTWVIREDRDGAVWVGTSDGLSVLRDNKFTTYTAADGLPKNNIRALYEEPDGAMWVATGGGLSLMTGGNFKTYTTADGLSTNDVRGVYRDRRGTLWAGTRSGLNRLDGNRFAVFRAGQGLPHDAVWSMYEDRGGTLWFGTGAGLSVRGPEGQPIVYPTPPELARAQVWEIHEDRDGALWFGTNGAGLFRWRAGAFTRFTAADGLFDDVVYRVLEDDRANLWMSCNRGIFRVSRGELDEFARGVRARVTAVTYDEADGMRSRECNGGTQTAGWRTRDGRLWFPTIKGVVVIDPNNIELNRRPPPVYVEEIVADGRTLGADRPGLELAAGTEKVELHYTALSFAVPGRVRFRYRLEGFDREWTDAGTRRTAFYTNLPPGDYHFRVIACNNDGVWNEAGADVTFRLAPRFYQTAWFAALCAAALGVLVLGAYRWRVRQMRHKSEEHFRSLIENASDLIMILDAAGTIRYHSPSLERTLMNRGRPLLGGDLFAHVHPDDQAQAREHLLGGLEREEATDTVEFRYQHLDGTWRVQEAVGKKMRDKSGARVIIVNSRDVTDRKRVEEQLVHNAFHDPLTGLPNRAMFMNRLTVAVERARRDPQHSFAVLFVDLDRFKVINDSLGHLVGDKLLVAIGRRLAATLRPGDTLARLGGDEFTILLERVEDERGVRVVADRLRKIFAQVFDLDGHQVFATASIGITFSSPSYERPEDLLRDADTAMYRAKHLGKDRHEVFDQTMRDAAVARHSLEVELRRAIERQEFRVHYQPIVSLTDDEITDFEALVRWQHPARGLLPPGAFLPVAEETGLIVEIGWWVLEEACRQARRWQTEAPAESPRSVSVNLSNQQLMQPDMVERVTGALRRTACDPRMLKLEITEHAMIDNAETLLGRLERLRALGVEFSLDDFGTGYSSLSYIHRFPVSTLKLDRSFISRIGADTEDALSIVRTIVMLARGLGMNVVAEGVETEAQLEHLKKLQCEYGQGFLLYKPADAERTAALLEETSAAQAL